MNLFAIYLAGRPQSHVVFNSSSITFFRRNAAYLTKDTVEGTTKRFLGVANCWPREFMWAAQNVHSKIL